MSQCEISASNQSVTTDSAATNAAAPKAEGNAPGAGAPLTPVAVDAPGIAPADPSAGADAAVTIDLEPITSVTHWRSPNAQSGPRAGSSWRPEGKPDAAARQWQIPRVPRLAAAIALAIAGGVVAGSLGTLWITRADQGEQVLARSETNQLKSAIERLNSDLVAVRASVESASRGANTQFTRLTERMDKVERVQTEPAAKIAKINETLERLDRRTRDLPDLAPVPERIAAPVPIKEIPRVSVVPGWVVRSVYDGMALIQGRIGLIEVEVGDPLPGGGRVEAIRRQDGRWVVVTSKGLILAAQ
jgi:outer membrane murein-binding lipoprotein Lpp